jgi:hypothetical protein
MGRYKFENLLRSTHVNFLLCGGIFIAFFLLSMPHNSESVPVRYSNHTSDRYGIQFQYPSDWELKEKTNRFEETSDITVNKVTLNDTGLITISYSNATFGKFGEYGIEPVTTRVYVIYNAMMGDYNKETQEIEQPSFVNIDGQKAGTFILAQKNKYDENAINMGVQIWLVYSGNKSWFIAFTAPTNIFDSSKDTEIRDHFIKSIKFPGINNATRSNATSN